MSLAVFDICCTRSVVHLQVNVASIFTNVIKAYVKQFVSVTQQLYSGNVGLLVLFQYLSQLKYETTQF